MWPSIRRWRDWAMHDLWNLTRSGLQPQALHYSFEKAGLLLHDQPVPWNAEAVIVEALVQLPEGTPRRKADFTLRLPGCAPLEADSLRARSSDDKTRLHFRLPPPAHSTAAEVFWRERRLGALTLPILTQEEFLANLRLQLPTVFVRVGEQNVACQTFVATQCRGLMVSAILTSPTSLVPLLDLDLRVECRSDRGTLEVTPAHLCSSQLTDRQALVAVVPKRFPKRIGTWTVTWSAGNRSLASQRVRAIGQRTFQRSLRVADTHFVMQLAGGGMTVSRQLPPLEQVARAGPCFLVSSKEPGMAGLCTLQTRVQMTNASPSAPTQEHEVLITDGPAVVAPGTLGGAELSGVTAFELKLKGASLGMRPITPVPPATFTSEGGFIPTSDFSWSHGAEDELNDRLARLLEARGKDDS
jgi:hypothetical protein